MYLISGFGYASDDLEHLSNCKDDEAAKDPSSLPVIFTSCITMVRSFQAHPTGVKGVRIHEAEIGAFCGHLPKLCTSAL